MNDIDLIDSYRANLPVQYAYLFTRSDTGVEIDSDPRQTSVLFAPKAVHVHTGCFAFPFYTPTKLLIQLHIKHKTDMFSIL